MHQRTAVGVDDERVRVLARMELGDVIDQLGHRDVDRGDAAQRAGRVVDGQADGDDEACGGRGGGGGGVNLKLFIS